MKERDLKRALIGFMFIAFLLAVYCGCLVVVQTKMEVQMASVTINCPFENKEDCKNLLFWANFCEKNYRDDIRLGRCRSFVSRLGDAIRARETRTSTGGDDAH